MDRKELAAKEGVCLFGGGGVRSARSPESSWEDLHLFMKSKKGNVLAPIPNLMPKPIYCVCKDRWHTCAVHTHACMHARTRTRTS